MLDPNTLTWAADVALPGFEAITLRLPDDYDGSVCATLVRCRAPQPTTQAVLYLHGFTDYFFQRHLAEAFIAQGYHFYALDLRKYGRSLAGARHPNFCHDVHEYFAELSLALRLITTTDAPAGVVLMGHSTGGLISTLYADHGPERHHLRAVVLNSPFFGVAAKPSQRAFFAAFAGLGAVWPFAALRSQRPLPYFQSIHATQHGEWDFDLQWRPLYGFPFYAGWLRAVMRAHQQVRAGLAIACPVLVLHASVSVHGAVWHPGYQSGDGVLDVAHMRAGQHRLGAHVTVREIKDGLHDLVLSRPEVRAQVFAELFGWLHANVEAGV